MYAYWLKTSGVRAARWRYGLAVVRLIRPFTSSVIKRSRTYPQQPAQPSEGRWVDVRITASLQPVMIRNYVKIAWRTVARNKVYSAINMGGLALGMAVAIFTGLWIRDELTFDRSFAHHDRLGQVIMYQTFSGQREPQDGLPLGLADALRADYPDLKEVAASSWDDERILAYGDQKIARHGNAVEPQFTRMFSLKMRQGVQDGLQNVRSIMLSASTATALFGQVNPVGKLVRIDGKNDLVVTGVYEDLPANTSFYTQFKQLQFLTPLAYYATENEWVGASRTDWANNAWLIFVQLHDKARFDAVSSKIKRVVANRRGVDGKPFQPELTLMPMSDWHLRSLFDQAGGQIQLVWLFGLIGGFVLVLACINFVNLSTARAGKRAKEVGIRKAVGSQRGQLAGQFLTESLLMVVLAFGLSLLVVWASLPWFNTLADKSVRLPWNAGWFWLICLLFMGGTTLLAGSYPAFVLSSFQPVRVLKGRLSLPKTRWVISPRKGLVVVQFTVSVALMIGTLVVYRQIQFANNRPIGYNRSGLIDLAMNTPELYHNYNRLRAELLATGAVLNMAESLSPLTAVWSNTYMYEWPDKAPTKKPIIGRVGVTHDFGKTVGFQVVSGRDFSRTYRSDSNGVILNESAVKVMGLSKPIGALIREQGQPPRHVVGVVKDLLMQSPYNPVMPTVFQLSYTMVSTITFRLNPTVATADALKQVTAVFNQLNPNAPFDYRFVDDTFAQKFKTEARIGRLALVLAILAIFISCLGLFGLASFTAEQRTKEIGVRKVLGASALHLWGLLSREFVILVTIAFFVATPIAYYVLSNWLQQYSYRTAISWWIFAVSGGGALVITLLTVSSQSVKAVLTNPVKSLRSE
ncbi:ABC transporter permease [Spirosoma agri]